MKIDWMMFEVFDVNNVPDRQSMDSVHYYHWEVLPISKVTKAIRSTHSSYPWNDLDTHISAI
ncbi:hypothetical protein N7456_003204 [Penicillium angulare]|uniref:Uncharacterized protein n=1 Tax=Penicillium angulare TaxID=116970 RepID=A0A9W9KHA9_9EURO|nr:hypothetical protein N7456_003204 [Penicillium angulare]